MGYIGLGALGLLLLLLFEVVSLKRVRGVKVIAWGLGGGLLGYSLITLAFSPDKMSLPAWSNWLGWALMPPAVFFKIYTMFLSLPFGKTYVATGAGDRLVTSGIYALVRCPWIHSFALFLLSLVLISGSRILLIGSLILISLNIILAVIQDRYFFDKMFSGYARYRKQTPMLLPNRRSISACIRSLKTRV